MPCIASAQKFLIRDVQGDRALDRVDCDAVAIHDKRNRSSFLGLRRDVADHKSMRPSAKAPSELPDPDRFLAEEALKRYPGEILAADPIPKSVPGRIY